MSSREIIPGFAGNKKASPATEIKGKDSKEDELPDENVERTPVERTPLYEQETDTIDEVWRKVTITGDMISSSKDSDDLPRIDEETEGKHTQLLFSQGEQPPLYIMGGLGSEKAKKKVTMHDGARSTGANIHLMIDGDICSKSANAKIGSALKASHSVLTSISTLENLLNDPVGKNGNHDRGNSPEENGSRNISPELAWERLTKAFVYYKGKPVGTLAALDPSADALNYNQIFIRDFVPCGLACLMKESREDWDVVKNFLLKTLHLQHHSDKKVDNHTLAKGVMPASFEVKTRETNGEVFVLPDFGGKAIGRVAPMDSGFWWIILLKAYTKRIGHHSLSELPDVQRGIKDILNLCLAEDYDACPTFLCADGCCMIDRRMDMYGYPLEIQALFFYALKCAKQLLIPEHGAKELISLIDKRIASLSYHIQNYYWLDFTQLNNIYRYKTEEYSHTAVNKFNVIPESIPGWVFDFMPLQGGYFVGNVGPSRMDFRWFSVGNCIAILSSLATPEQANAIMDLIEAHWSDLIGEMPLKIAYPALQGHEWRIVTGCDPKNTAWSYHNGGSWPVLLWLLTAASIKTGRPHIAKRAIQVAEERLAKDGWPEYYDGKTGRFVGKQARKYQTWSIAGYLVAKLLIENPANIRFISSLEEDRKKVKPKLGRSSSWPPFKL